MHMNITLNRETKLSKVRGVTIGLICLVILAVGTGIIGLWKLLCVPVIGAFAELGRDLKTIMKGG